MTTVASNHRAAVETLETVEWCTKEFGVGTIMGLSNISFGLPKRKLVNTAFFAMAISKGLTMAIANPSDELLMNLKLACDVLSIRDKDSLEYIKSFNESKKEAKAPEVIMPIDQKNDTEKDILNTIHHMVVQGKKRKHIRLC